MPKYLQGGIAKTLLWRLEFFAVALFLYLTVTPFLPGLIYQLQYSHILKNMRILFGQEQVFTNSIQPVAETVITDNRLLIPKIGVDAPIVEAPDERGLDSGAWRLPKSSTPDQGGNMVVTGHRFKYLPPNNLTFYLFDKLTAGDEIIVWWQKQKYLYTVSSIKIIEPTDFSILQPTKEPTLTMFTCHPLFSQSKRLAVIAKISQKRNKVQ